ncbi:MAG: UDP-N-acetylmuramoyl-L-alanyl-D-glutamate--2,6-diaminopimelate ligase, partial [Candidatus Cloacimonetes bacterium 4572_65]
MKIDTTTIIDKLNKDKLLISKNIIDENCSYGDVRIDSRQIQKDDIFIAIKGLSVDGHDYIETAISKGASLIIHSTKCDIAINSILVKNSRKAGALITSELYDNPSHKTKLIGITGTNGKTTTTNILFDILTKAGVNCGRIGTLGYSFGNTTYSLQRTTPDITELNKILYDMVEYGCEVIIMEVSSHSLILDRVYGQKFSAVGFTNLTQDHLDFHKTFENYFQAKKIIFDMVQEAGGFAVINCDDLQGKLYFKHFNSTKFSYGKDDQSNYCFSDIKISSNLTSFKLSTGKKECLINTNYYGQFNIYNIVLAIALCKELLPNLQLEKNSFANLAPTAGRLEFISSQSLGHAFLDYAHTPDAIKNVLNTLAEMEHNRIITVVGCGGDRDRSKRPLMSKVACQLSDLVIFTDDNPRNEQGSAIIYDMLENNYSSNYIILRDRKRAISTALNLAKEGDLVAILGKGHELYQEVAGEKLPFSDRDVIEAFRTITPTEEIAIPYDILNLHDIIKKELDNSYNFRNITIPMIEVTNIS